ncbi:MAG: O-antigen ligase family protein [Planctomycetes bacterium]|nr:O-antigen ligase family protein [Planctomycetota bacterium]
MLAQSTVDAGARITAFMDAYGVAGVGVLVVLAVSLIALQFVKGSGLSLLLLISSYSLIFVESSGVSTAAFFVRTLVLVSLVLSLARRFVVPGWAFWGMFLYAMLGLVCGTRAPKVWWSLQNGGLLVVTTVALTIGLAGYLRSLKQVDALFRMFVVAGVIWCAASMPFALDFVAGRALRFGGGTSVHATNYAASGALLFPFMLWAAMQKGRWLWRLVGVGGMAVILFCLFLSGTRTGFVVAGVACAPLLLRRGGGHHLRISGLVGLVGIALAFGGARLLQGRSTDFLMTRLTSVGLGGREALWSKAFEVILESPVIGRGIGSHNALATEVGISEFHNAYLAVWCNAGAIGLLLVLSVLFYYALHACLLLRRVENPLGQDALRVALGFLLAIGARGLVENSFASASNASIATLLIALTLVSTLRGFVLSELANAPGPRPQPRSGLH